MLIIRPKAQKYQWSKYNPQPSEKQTSHATDYNPQDTQDPRACYKMSTLTEASATHLLC